MILQAVGPSLKTIRFNITEKIESPWDYERKRRKVPLERTEDLAAYRFEISSVESVMANGVGSSTPYGNRFTAVAPRGTSTPGRHHNRGGAGTNPSLKVATGLEISVLCIFRKTYRVRFVENK